MAITVNAATLNSGVGSIGALFNSGKLQLRTGSPPGANNAATGTLVCDIPLPATAFGTPSGGVAAKAGTWSVAAGNAGTVEHFRMVSSDSSKVIEGKVTATGGDGDLTMLTTSVANTQVVTINTFTLTLAA